MKARQHLFCCRPLTASAVTLHFGLFGNLQASIYFPTPFSKWSRCRQALHNTITGDLVSTVHSHRHIAYCSIGTKINLFVKVEIVLNMMDLNPSRQWPWFRACDGLCWIWVEFGAFYETLQCSFVYFGEEQSCWQRLGSMCGGSTVKLLNCARLIFGLFRDNFQDQGWSLCLHTSPPRPHRLVSNCPDQIYVQYVQMIDICKTLRKM